MSFFFQSMCLVYWISDYDYMMLFIRLCFHVSLNIISFHIVYLVWGRYNFFCRSLGVRGAGRELKGCLDQPSFVKVWTIIISKTCLYMLAEHCASLFQPQYIDGLLNPSHRTFSFTTSSQKMKSHDYYKRENRSVCMQVENEHWIMWS